jgi:hypothetical protein
MDLVPVHALFQRHVSGDEALLELAALRFAQMGVAAEVYADNPDQLEDVLRFAPAHPRLPTVHLNRGLNLLRERDRAAVKDFAGRFAGRVTGFVVHDSRDMGTQSDQLLAAMRELDAFLRELPAEIFVFLEYAAGLEPAWYTDVAERLKDTERVSFCIDVGHIGIRQANARFARHHPDVTLADLGDRLPELVADVQDAVGGALDDLLGVVRSIGQIGKPVHFHLHDGHPLIRGLSDHFSFLDRYPIPFPYEGRQSLNLMYGPGGLASIVSTAIGASSPGSVSFTLEIHQAEGRLPLGDAGSLFSHWRDKANAERMNYWLNVLAENALLISAHGAPVRPDTRGEGQR